MTGGSKGATGTPRDEDLKAGEDPATPEAPVGSTDTIDDTRFAHHSEAEMARILDFYQVRWEYEPTTFPILWNLDGDVVESFAPDFYLPDLEVYLEMTTLRQRLVRKKNRKLRRLRELYPDVRIKLFYARDFRAMMLKYGRLGLAESLSGTPGQVVPQRQAAAAPAVAVGEALIVDETATAGGPPSDEEAPLPADAIVAELDAVEGPASATGSAPAQPVSPATPRAAARSRSGRRRRRAGQAARLAPEREARA